ncbi:MULTISPECIES: aspartyl/asparaginyl beta-hydroxylase domain-containing protein [Sphingomonas]|uniref:aspartyl/asparaginyl beta-hydroxylase domain-containing protein n=1 Tax=Sphingomonas TaxID=13687 RepID=UPI000DEFD722|nr:MULTISPECIES: aspartyl/asparaginyl beta-hydroxylase domain-containing protein [Sphingomonas]
MARGDLRQASSLLEQAAQRGRDATTLLRLATVYRALGDYPKAAKAAAAAVELEPRNFLMSLLLGSLREAMGAPHAAERAYRAACANAPRDLVFQPAMAKQLAHAKAWVRAADAWRQALLGWAPEPGSLGPDEERRMRGFQANLLENLGAGAMVAPDFRIPRLRPQGYFERSEFPGVATVERETDAIRAEYRALVADRSELSAHLSALHGAEGQIGRAGEWTMIPLMRNGEVVEEFASRCPRTMAATAHLARPHLPLISPSLYFSILAPGSHIPPHTGLTNARVIVHFPLIVPDRCGFRVAEETREWREGEALIFDDMTMHEAWNDSDETRVVLIADLWRPELSEGERAAVRQLLDCPEPVAA